MTDMTPPVEARPTGIGPSYLSARRHIPRGMTGDRFAARVHFAPVVLAPRFLATLVHPACAPTPAYI
jgi:hypothetical protein